MELSETEQETYLLDTLLRVFADEINYIIDVEKIIIKVLLYLLWIIHFKV